MKYQPNIGQAFPLESLGSDLARNSFNYQSIMNALIEWNTTSEPSVMVRLTKDTAPWYEDFEIPSKKSVLIGNDITATQKGSVGVGSFAVDSILNVAAYGGVVGDSTEPGDILTLRFAVTDAGNTSWSTYYAPLIHDWVSGMYVREKNYYRYGDRIYIAGATLDSYTLPDEDPGNFTLAIKPWVYKSEYEVGEYVSFNGIVYIVTAFINSSINSPDDSYGFAVFAKPLDTSVTYAAGSIIYANNSIYMSMSECAGVSVDSTDIWREMFVRKLTNVSVFNKSNIARYDVDVDTAAIIVRNISDDLASSSTTLIGVQQSIQTRGNPSIYQRSTGVYPSVNYVSYPNNLSPIWSESSPIDHTDTNLDITKRQSYSATWIMDHANQKENRTINFINYDGPDLDQGLCIYLPVEVELSTGEIVEPEDGFTYEMYIRIWANAKYTTNGVTRDHIVNKSQVYVYNALNKESIAMDRCSYPIAKFSMARMTNFHVFGENITIPDKPVVYRATFTYLSANKSWTMLDYYQLPDHVFVGPVGFIDPTNPGNSDMYIDGINPDASHIGYETSALPTYVDVFSQPNLTPYRSSDGSFFSRGI